MHCSVPFRRAIAMPENRKPPAGTGGHSENDQLAGEIDSQSMPDLAAVAEGALETVVGLLLTSPTVEGALELLGDLPAHIQNPVLSWWLVGIRLSAEAGIRPNPCTAVDRAIRAGFDTPPALRGLPLSAGWELVGNVSGVPMVCAAELVRIVRDGHVRRAVELAGERIKAAAWRGDLDSLAELVQVEAGALLASLAAALVTGDA